MAATGIGASFPSVRYLMRGRPGGRRLAGRPAVYPDGGVPQPLPHPLPSLPFSLPTRLPEGTGVLPAEYFLYSNLSESE